MPGHEIVQRENGDLPLKSPTTLAHLFEIPESERAHVHGLYSMVDSYRSSFANARNALEKLEASTIERIDNGGRFRIELEAQQKVIATSLTMSNALLYVAENPPQEDMEFPQLVQVIDACINIDTWAKKKVKLHPTNSLYSALLAHSNPEQSARSIQEILQAIGQPPGWFKGNQIEWIIYVNDVNTACFTAEKEKDLPDRLMTNEEKQDIARQSAKRGNIYNLNHGMPDWYEKFKTGETVSLQEVKKEFDEDLNEYENLIIQTVNSVDKIELLLKSYFARFDRFTGHYNNRISDINQHIIQAKTSFINNVLSSLTQSSNDLPLSLYRLVFDDKDHQKKVDELQKSSSLENRIKAALPDTNLFPETIALWLEAQFCQTGLIKTVLQTGKLEVHDYLIEFINKTLSRRKGEKPTQSELKAQNSRAYRIFDNEISPLLDVLTDDELEDFRETVDIFNGPNDSLEDLIWYIGKKISNQDRKIVTKRSMATITAMNKHARTFVQSNYQWILERVQKQVSKTTPKDIEPSSTSQDIQKKLQEEIRETEQQIRDVQLGKLDGWTILYATQKRSDGEIIQIEGNSLEEIGQFMSALMIKEGIKISLPAHSIANTIEYMASLPPDIYQTWAGEEANGEMWKKLKRDDTRIYCQRDITSQTLTFFMIPRKEWKHPNSR